MNTPVADTNTVAGAITSLVGLQTVVIAGVSVFVGAGVAFLLRGVERINTVFTLVFVTATLALTLTIFNQRTQYLTRATVEANLQEWQQQRLGNGVKITFTVSTPAYAYLTYRSTPDQEFFPYTMAGDLQKATAFEIMIPQVPESGGEIYIYVNNIKNPPGDPFKIQ